LYILEPARRVELSASANSKSGEQAVAASPSSRQRTDAPCRRPPVKRRNLILILASTTALSALALTAARARDVPKVATGFVANVVCTETFVSGPAPG
jgi:hypothetical protein